MKKLFTLFAFALAAASVSAQDAKITISGPWYDTTDVTVAPEGTVKDGRTGYLIVNMENSVEIQGYQFNVSVPDGATFNKWVMDYEGSHDRYTYYDDEDDEGEPIKVLRWAHMAVGADATKSTYVGVYKSVDPKADVATTPNIAEGNGPIGRVEIRIPNTFTQPEDNKIRVFNIAMTDKDGNTIIQNEQKDDALTVDMTVVSTGIEAVTVESLAGKEVFNLSGQRVASPTQRGIYIVNGKKLYVK